MRYLWHITLTTGHTSRSISEDVDPQVRAALRPVIEAAIAGRSPIVPGPPGVSLQVLRAEGHMMATVWDDASDLPLVTLGVARRSRGAARLWDALHQGAQEPVTNAADVPRAPWCGVVIHPTVLTRPDALTWLGSLEQCIAWTWLEMADGA